MDDWQVDIVDSTIRAMIRRGAEPWSDSHDDMRQEVWVYIIDSGIPDRVDWSWAERRIRAYIGTVVRRFAHRHRNTVKRRNSAVKELRCILGQ